MLTKYQPHIDLLRALAVFLVILNHLEFSFFSGGFIGVDIFFVLSGYLITQNIINEKAQTDKFSFLAFTKFFQKIVAQSQILWDKGFLT